VTSDKSSLSTWTPQQIAEGKRWVQAWRKAGPLLDEVRRRELREFHAERSIALLCGPANYHVAPRAPKPTSGLVEQQRWFMIARSRD
jgi:hypothetical protein